MSEKKYIDVDLLKNEICKNKIMSRELIAQRILHIIDEQPTADVTEVKHGYWIDIPLNVYNDMYGMNKHNKRIKCSVCTYAMPYEYPRFHICPNCGAKMGKEQEC